MKTINAKEIKDFCKKYDISMVEYVAYNSTKILNLRPILKQMDFSTNFIKHHKKAPPLYLIELDWVETEYCPLFSKGNRDSCMKRMTRFIKENNVTKDEILGAAKFYLSTVDYPRESHYFIFKGTGVNQISDLKEWINKYKSLNHKGLLDDEMT